MRKIVISVVCCVLFALPSFGRQGSGAVNIGRQHPAVANIVRALLENNPSFQSNADIARSVRRPAAPSINRPRHDTFATVTAHSSNPWAPPPMTHGGPPIITSNAQYIQFLQEGGGIGVGQDCNDRFTVFVNFFGYDAAQSGHISHRPNTPNSGRLDNICEFLGHAHWCFALGFAFAVREPDDPIWVHNNNRCMTYREFCQHHRRNFEQARLNDYLSRIMNEISVYVQNIRGTNRNIVQVITETRRGNSVVTETTWRVYDIDTWVNNNIPQSEMIRMLCR